VAFKGQNALDADIINGRASSLKMNSYGPRLPVTSASNQSRGISTMFGMTVLARDELSLGPAKSVRTDRNQPYPHLNETRLSHGFAMTLTFETREFFK